MKVLLINHFPLEGSGSGTYTRDVASFLQKGGHEACIVFPENKKPEALSDVMLCPVYFNSCPVSKDALPYNYPCFTTHPRSTTTFADLDENELDEYLEVFDKAISWAVDNFKPDIIHVQHVWILAYLAAKHPLPLVITAHGTDLMGYDKWPALRDFASKAADAADSVIAISKDNYLATLERFPQLESKTIQLSNGYNNDIFYPEYVNPLLLLAGYCKPYEGEKIVLFAGKLTNFKGVDVFLHAVKKYEDLYPDTFSTLIAGSGEESENLQNLAKELDLKSTCFIGHRSQLELRQLYSTADVFVIPSRYEAFGLVALEAMACGVPIVATNKGGLPDFVTSEVGTLVDCDPDALFDGVLKEIEKSKGAPNRRPGIAEYALAHYSMAHYVEELVKIYSDVIEQH